MELTGNNAGNSKTEKPRMLIEMADRLSKQSDDLRDVVIRILKRVDTIHPMVQDPQKQHEEKQPNSFTEGVSKSMRRIQGDIELLHQIDCHLSGLV